jgi:hypothetical protein
MMLAGLLTAGCVACGNAEVKAAGSPDQYRMQRGPCFGICPSYDLVLKNTGAYQLSSKGRAAGAAVRQGQLDAAQMERIRAAARALSSLEPSLLITPGQAACGDWATDQPTVELELLVAGQKRHIKHYLGCTNAPAALRSLESLLEQSTGAAGSSTH